MEPTIDFGRTAADYARYRADFPPRLFRHLRREGFGLPGQRVLDLGTGTGALARGLAARGNRVVALDKAAALLHAARGLARHRGSPLAPVQAVAEALPFPAASFDGIAAGQCWHWFDRPRAAAEVWRVLRSGGQVALAHFDWIPLPGNLVQATEALIKRYNPAWANLQVLRLSGSTGLYPAWFRDLALAGFTDIRSFSFDVQVPYTHEAWRGRIRASAGVAAARLAPEVVAAFDADLARLLRERFPQEPLAVHHRVFAVLARKP